MSEEEVMVETTYDQQIETLAEQVSALSGIVLALDDSIDTVEVFLNRRVTELEKAMAAQVVHNGQQGEVMFTTAQIIYGLQADVRKLQGKEVKNAAEGEVEQESEHDWVDSPDATVPAHYRHHHPGDNDTQGGEHIPEPGATTPNTDTDGNALAGDVPAESVRDMSWRSRAAYTDKAKAYADALSTVVRGGKASRVWAWPRRAAAVCRDWASSLTS
jgi:hypothetical protein